MHTRMLVGFLLLFSCEVQAADKYALLIGVSKYEHSEMNKPEPLKFPEEDAKALGDLLKKGGYGVEIMLGKEATREGIEKRLSQLTTKGSSDGIVLIGLFGHGVEIETKDSDNRAVLEGCFCPFDTVLRAVKDSQGRILLNGNGQPLTEPDPSSLIKLSNLMINLKLAKSGHRVVLADCCRTVPNQARGRSFGAGFRAQDLPDSTSVLFGCSPNEKAFEHQDWGHGAFTKCLLEAIEELSVTGDVDTAQLAGHLRKRVPTLVATVSPRDRQTPKLFTTDLVDLQLRIKRVDPRIRIWLEKAVDTTRRSNEENDIKRVKQLLKVSSCQRDSGLVQEGERTYQLAMESYSSPGFQQIADNYDYRDIAELQVENGHIDDAIASYNQISGDSDRGNSGLQIADALAEQGEIQRAIEFLTSAIGDRKKQRFVEHFGQKGFDGMMACRMHCIGKADEAAIRIAKDIENPEARSLSIANIASVQIAFGDHDGALSTLELIDDSNAMAAVLCGWKSIPLNNPEVMRAIEIGRKATDEPVRMRLLMAIESRQIDTGKLADALNTFTEIEAYREQVTDENLHIGFRRQFAELIRGLSIAFANAGDLKNARSLAERLDMNDSGRSMALSRIAVAHIRTGNRKDGMTTFGEAQKQATDPAALLQLAKDQWHIGHEEGCKATLNMAESTAIGPSLYDVIESAISIAGFYVEIGENESAKRILERAIDRSIAEPDRISRSSEYSLGKLAAAQCKNGLPLTALERAESDPAKQYGDVYVVLSRIMLGEDVTKLKRGEVWR